MNKGRTLLVDADVLVYRIAASVEEVVEFGDNVDYHADLDAAVLRVQNWVDNVHKRLGGMDIVMCLSCPTGRYFRHDIAPDYKGQRKGMRKPILLQDVKEFVVSEYVTATKPGLEADDVLGILATGDYIPGKKCITSIDKDLDQIPGPHFKLDDPECTLYKVEPEEGALLHLYQTLTGDTIDNYPGCPGIGAARAKRVVYEGQAFEPDPACFTRGPRKGESKGIWRTVQTDKPWDGVVSCFRKAGSDEGEALRQARLAKILTAEEWDSTHGIVHWNPPV